MEASCGESSSNESVTDGLEGFEGFTPSDIESPFVPPEKYDKPGFAPSGNSERTGELLSELLKAYDRHIGLLNKCLERTQSVEPKREEIDDGDIEGMITTYRLDRKELTSTVQPSSEETSEKPEDVVRPAAKRVKRQQSGGRKVSRPNDKGSDQKHPGKGRRKEKELPKPEVEGELDPSLKGEVPLVQGESAKIVDAPEREECVPKLPSKECPPIEEEPKSVKNEDDHNADGPLEPEISPEEVKIETNLSDPSDKIPTDEKALGLRVPVLRLTPVQLPSDSEMVPVLRIKDIQNQKATKEPESDNDSEDSSLCLKDRLDQEKQSQESDNVESSENALRMDVEAEKIEEPVEADYLLPSEKGWKRHVNLRGDTADIVYIHPLGLRLKDMEDVEMNLTDGLTVANFTFSPKPLNLDPKFETIIPELVIDRMITEDTTTSDNVPDPNLPVRKSGRVPVPSSNYKIVEKMEREQSRKRGHTSLPEKKNKLVIKFKNITAPSSPESSQDKNLSLTVASSKLKQEKHDFKRKQPKRRRTLTFDYPDSSNPGDSWSPAKLEEQCSLNCNIGCPEAMGLIPSLHCRVCLCLYHPECVGVGVTGHIDHIHGYVCQNCRVKPDYRTSSPAASVPERQLGGALVGSEPPPVPAVPQFVVTLNRRRFIVVPNTTPPAAGPPNPPPLEQPPVPATAPVTPKPSVKKSILDAAKNFFSDACASYKPLLQVFEYLSMEDRLRASSVCRLLRSIALDPLLWKKVTLNASTTDWTPAMRMLQRVGTKQLTVLTGSPPFQIPDLVAVDISTHLTFLEELEMPYLEPETVEHVLRSIPYLKCLRTTTNPPPRRTSSHIDLAHSPALEEVSYFAPPGLSWEEARTPDLAPSRMFQQNSNSNRLRVVALRDICTWSPNSLQWLAQLPALTKLTLGDCLHLTDTKPWLERLHNLTELRLENCYNEFCTVELLETVATLPRLEQLELINFDETKEPERLGSVIAGLNNIQRLLLLPKFAEGDSNLHVYAAKIAFILRGVYGLKKNLKSLVFLFSKELVHATQIFVDDSVNEIIPVTKPLPLPEDRHLGEPIVEDGTFAVVSLTRLENILKTVLPGSSLFVGRVSFDEAKNQSVKKLLPQ